MNRSEKIVVGVVLVALFGVIGFFAMRPAAKLPQQPIVLPNTSSSQLTVAPMVTEENETDYLTIDMTYPQSSQNKYSEMYTFIKNSKDEFLHDYGNITAEEAATMQLGSDRKYNYLMSTKVATSTNTVTYIIDVYTYTGGAHGGTGEATFTYDKNGRLVTLNDLFTAPYLDRIVPLARAYFMNKFEHDSSFEDSINEGTAPNMENYAAWYLTDDTITFIFQQYSIGPYVIGIQEFPLPKSAVADILSPRFQ